MKTINEHLYLAVKIKAKSREVVMLNGDFYLKSNYDFGSIAEKLPYQCEFICLASEMTEEVAKGLVELSDDENCLDFYKCYDTTIRRSNGITSQTIAFATALESFHSLMEANEMYLVNPMGKEPIVYEFNHTVDFLNKHNIWQSYQNKLSDYVILKRK